MDSLLFANNWAKHSKINKARSISWKTPGEWEWEWEWENLGKTTSYVRSNGGAFRAPAGFFWTIAIGHVSVRIEAY